MVCNGNSSEYCGGSNRLDTYKYGGGTGTGGGGGTTPTTTKTSPTATGSGSATNLPAGWAYKGCWIDGANGRILATQEPDSQTNTIEACVATCKTAGYKVAGLEYGSQCFCGNSIVNGGVLATSDSDCNVACSGAANEKCGAGNRMSIYATGTLVVSGAPGPQTSNLPGSWVYQNCIT